MAEDNPRYERVAGLDLASRSEVIAPQAMVATSQPLATQVALDILRAGRQRRRCGDRRQCGARAHGADRLRHRWRPVRHRMGCRDRRELVGLNASGRSPKSLTIELPSRPRVWTKSRRFWVRSAGHPFLAQSTAGSSYIGRYGRLPMEQTCLLRPSAMREEGFPVSEVNRSRLVDRNARRHRRNIPGVAETYMPARPQRRTTGDIFRQSGIGRGPIRGDCPRGTRRDAFYEGEVADNVLNAYMAEQGGLSDCYDDLADARVRVDHTGVDQLSWLRPVYELPPNGQGIAALQLLNILEGYDIAKTWASAAPNTCAYFC